MVGQTISHYRIVEKLGEGGMGVVYKAEDTKLRRNVALKFLSRDVLDNEEVSARLIREAQAAASLDHPNICAVHGIHEEEGQTFIAMAFIDGPSLAEKIKERPLPLEGALDIAGQIAEGLQDAHEKGIVHRDVKPHNIMLTTKGQVKIMDFGLAALTGRSKLTKTGTTLGTLAYMAPEQLEGGKVDLRADVWALGCVLYEMLTQKTPFDAEYEQAIGYGILNEEPEPVTALRSGLPTEIDRVISKALAKDPALRYQHADDLLADLRMLRKASDRSPDGQSRMTPAGAAPEASNASRRLPWGIAAILGAALLALSAVHFSESPPDARVRRSSFAAPPGINEGVFSASLALSPDGMRVAYSDTDGLWVQDLDQDEPRRLAGTEGAQLPFWSPDSAFIGYAADGELRKISARGGASGLVCPLPGPFFSEGTWSPDDGLIVFSSYVNGERILFSTSSEGGSAEELIAPGELDQTASQASTPHFVRGASDPVLLFTVGTAVSTEMYARNLYSGRTAALGPGDHPVFSPATGHLIYQAGRADYDLWVRPFSPDSLEFTGSAFPLRQDARQPSASDDGTVAYLDGTAAGAQALVWRGRGGERLETVGQPQPDMGRPAVSPDGAWVAVNSTESGNQDVWIHDATRPAKTRLTFDDLNQAFPEWSPSGREVMYRELGSATNRIMRTAADGTGEPETLIELENGLSAPEASRDGRYLAYYEISGDTRRDVRYVELGADGTPGDTITFIASSADELIPKFSPDGRLLAYVSDESGREEIYLRTFPTGGGKRQVSINGGREPRWREDGRELFYIEGSTLMAVSVSIGSDLALGEPQPLFRSAEFTSPLISGGYDVSADGERFLTIEPAEGDAALPRIRVVMNWYEEFRDREGGQ